MIRFLALLLLCLVPASAQTPGNFAPGESSGFSAHLNAQMATKTDAASEVYLKATNFGTCTWDATHDVAPCIQAAITYANTLVTGATIQVPAGNYRWGSTVTISKSLVSLEAPGHGSYMRDEVDLTKKISGTHFTWTGAAGGTMLTVSPPTDIVAGQALSGTNVKGILLDANQIADTCARFASTNTSQIDIACAEPAGSGVIFDTAAIHFSSSPQYNDVWLSVINRLGTGPAVVWDSTGNDIVGFANGNVSFNKFHRLILTIKNGDGLVSNHSDNNFVDWLAVQVLPGGTGNAVVFNGTNNVNAPNGSNSNFIMHYSSAGNFLVKGIGLTFPAKNNTILHLDTENSTPAPTIETGASLAWRRGDNIWSAGQGALQTDFSPTIAAMTRLQALTYQDPVRAYSSGNAGVLVGGQVGSLDVVGHMYIDTADSTMKLLALQNVSGISIGGPNSPLIVPGIARLSTTNGLTAHAGGGQASALALTSAVNRITTVVTAADSVKLPVSVAGNCVDTINGAANAMQVFGAGTDTINDVATATGVSVAGGKTGHWCSPLAGLWYGGTLN